MYYECSMDPITFMSMEKSQYSSPKKFNVDNDVTKKTGAIKPEVNNINPIKLT